MSGMIGSAKIPAKKPHGDDIQNTEPKRCSPRLLSNETGCGIATHHLFDTRNQEYSDDHFRLLIRKAANMSSDEEDTRKPIASPSPWWSAVSQPSEHRVPTHQHRQPLHFICPHHGGSPTHDPPSETLEHSAAAKEHLAKVKSSREYDATPILRTRFVTDPHARDE